LEHFFGIQQGIQIPVKDNRQAKATPVQSHIRPQPILEHTSQPKNAGT
jgi:hypothetical protein